MNLSNTPGPGDYPAFPRTDHPNDPANDIDDDPGVKLRREIADREEFNPAVCANFIEALEELGPLTREVIIGDFFEKNPQDELVRKACEYWGAQVELQAVAEEAKMKRIMQ